MTPETNPEPNVQQAVPFLMVSNIEASLHFYIDGLGFQRTNQWIVDNKIRWCWLQLGGAALMLQEYRPERSPPTNEEKASPSASNARTPSPSITRPSPAASSPKPHSSATASGSPPSPTPTATNSTSESPTDVPEETVYSDNLELSTLTPK
ncbi:MAG: hypothetical protein JWQ49_5501 [Edaphobacter sp.]|nr:hypothetical protein [Edaphobacter sp.]